jgi:aryl-alcohol dehydrogenase-like predicted oxidoreductase
MEYRKLGRSELKVSTVALGCMSLCAGQTYGEIPESQAAATVDAALDAGINFFDNAPLYGDGEAERRLGNALKGSKRDRAVVATKIGTATMSADETIREFEGSLQRLHTDRIDLYQIHWARRAVPVAETLRAMEKLVQQGKLRAIGVCNFGPLDLSEALASIDRLATNQMAYSLLARGVEYDVVPLCQEHGVGMLCYSPLAQGLLTGRYSRADEVPPERARTRHFADTRPQSRHGEPGLETETFEAIAAVKQICTDIGQPMADVALAWLLHQPTVTSVLAGASRPDQIQQNAKAAAIRLSPDILQRLDDATSIVKQKMGRNPDMWQAQSRIR